MRDSITLKKNNRIKKLFSEEGVEFEQFYILEDGVKIGRIRWGGGRYGWTHTSSIKGRSSWSASRDGPRSQEEAVEAFLASRQRTREWMRTHVEFI